MDQRENVTSPSFSGCSREGRDEALNEEARRDHGLTTVRFSCSRDSREVSGWVVPSHVDIQGSKPVPLSPRRPLTRESSTWTPHRELEAKSPLCFHKL